MPSSERKWNLSSVWRIVKRLLHVPLSTAERDELQRHGDGGNYGINIRSRYRTGRAMDLETRKNRRHDTENSDAKDICELKARSAVLEERIERLEGKVAEQSLLTKETLVKITSVDQAAKQRTAQKTEAIGRLEKKVAKLDRDLQEKTTALRSMVDRGDARKTDLLSAEGRQNSPQQKRTSKLLSLKDAASKRDQKIRDSSVTYQKLRHSTEGKRTNKPLPRAPVSTADSISVVDIMELVGALNAQLEQTSCLIVDWLSYQQSPFSGRGFGAVSSELRNYLGLWLCRDLQCRSREPDTEPDPSIKQIILQTGLVNACSRIINGWTPPDISRGVTDTRRTQTRFYTFANSNNKDINEKYLTSILRELINAIGGSLQSDEQLPHLYQADVECIARKVGVLHRIINEEPIPLRLATYTIPCGTEFDSSRMGDTERGGDETGSIPHDSVICTLEMGLQCLEPEKSRQEYGVTMKAKVVLTATLDAQGS